VYGLLLYVGFGIGLSVFSIFAAGVVLSITISSHKNLAN
jgi:hypothetical protein